MLFCIDLSSMNSINFININNKKMFEDAHPVFNVFSCEQGECVPVGFQSVSQS